MTVLRDRFLMKRVSLLLALVALWGLSCCLAAAQDAVPTGSATKIWDQAPHNAFTDLVRFNDRWFCVFREGKGHVSPDGALRVITSVDGEKWESAALIKSSNSDLRDAKITVTPDGQLMLCGAEALHDKSQHTHQSLAWFSKDGRTWSEKHAIGDPDFWLWRVTWHKGTAYGIGYGCGKEKSVRLYTSQDGKKFETLVERLFDVGYPNETSIVFEGDTAYCLLRRDGQGKELTNTGLLGVSQAPFTKWEWKDLGTRIGGPHMTRLPDGRFIAAVRLYDKRQRTSLCWLDPQAGKLTEFLTLPSGGDTSYAGLVLHEGLLWISYYSSHEGKTSIYVSKMPLLNAQRSLSDLSGEWQLLVDDWLVAEKSGVERVWHPFEKYAGNPVLTADQPWEGAISYLYGSVLPEENGKGYRMWYHSWADNEYRKLYATSRDGLKWEKPDLGQVEYKGSTKNNMFLRRSREDHSPQIIHTPADPDPQRRYKLITYEYGRTPPKYTVSGYLGACSPDGIHWTEAEQYPILRDPGDVGNFIWDPFTDRYIGYPKKFTDVRGFRRRCVGFTETSDFERWPTSQLTLIPDEFDDRWVKTKGQHTDFYGLSAFPYESMYLGFLWVFPITDGDNDGPIFVELVTSRDGVNWTRQDEPRIPVLPIGTQGTWDCGMVFTPNHPLVEGDRIRLYYGGFNVTHKADGQGAIGLATLRKDGFASLDAGAKGGVITTRPFSGMQGPLRLNSHTSDGSIRVEILSESGHPLPGFSRDECDAITGDSVDQTVTWRGSSRLPEDLGTVQLRFILQNASLYSFHAGDTLQVLQPDRGILYSGDVDSENTVNDMWLTDGAQDGRLRGPITIDRDETQAVFGKACLRFSDSASELTTIELPGTSQLGTSFTLAALIQSTSPGMTRLFSNYRGNGPPWTSELIVDIDPSGQILPGLRAAINGGEVQSGAIQTKQGRPLHVAVTYANGNVSLFLDGHEVGHGQVPAGPVLLGTNVRFGEDLDGVLNEQFAGVVDDILVVRRALSTGEIETLARTGAGAFMNVSASTALPGRPSRVAMPLPEKH